MEPAFSDLMLECAECKNQFVWTVAQQRNQYEDTGETSEPEYCPVCSVRMERMGQRVLEGAAAGAGGYGPAPTPEPRSVTDRPDRARSYEYAQRRQEEAPPRGGPTESSSDSSYVSGTGHPLHGHGGEEYNGTVKWFNDRKGFGFITLDNGVEIFVHYSGIEGTGYKTLKQGQRVKIEVEDTEKGPQATAVRVIGDESQPTQPTETEEA